MDSHKYSLAACGGTFDLFHKGHREILLTASNLSEKIIIGVVIDKFAKNLKEGVYEDFDVRFESVREFVAQEKINAEVIELDNIYGPTIFPDSKFDAIIVTEDSKNGGLLVNKKREELSLPPLEIITVPLIKGSDGKTISSTRIRNGEIDREGKLYITDEFLRFDYLLPEGLRERLSEPFGDLKDSFDKYLESSLNKKIISVGDAVTSLFLSRKIIPHIAIIDLNINRQKKFAAVHELGFENIEILKAINPAGHVTAELFAIIKKAFEKENVVIQIEGEEDLAVIPTVLVSPLGYEIYYGQPNEGVVRVKVTEQIKNEIKYLISQFRRKVI